MSSITAFLITTGLLVYRFNVFFYLSWMTDFSSQQDNWFSHPSKITGFPILTKSLVFLFLSLVFSIPARSLVFPSSENYPFKRTHWFSVPTGKHFFSSFSRIQPSHWSSWGSRSRPIYPPRPPPSPLECDPCVRTCV